MSSLFHPSAASARAAVRPTPRCGESVHRPGFRHAHTALANPDLHIVRNGSIRYQFAETTRTARAGTMIALPTGQTFVEADGPDKAGVRLAVLHFRAEGFPPWPDSIQTWRPRTATQRQGLLALADIFVETAMAWKNGDPLAEAGVEGLALSLLAIWHRHNRPTLSPKDNWVEPVLAYIDAHLADPSLDVSVLAVHANLSRSHFTRRFRASVGHAPGKYLTRRRIRLAKHLLAHGEAVSSTSIACGYTDPFHFSRVFKADTGVAPRDWGRD